MPEPAVEPAPVVEKLELQPVDFAQLSGWPKENFAEVIPVLTKNCQQIMQNRQPYIYEAEIKISTAVYQDACRRFLAAEINDGTTMRQFLESAFTPFAVTFGGVTEGKFTSYYEAVIHAAWEQDETYKFPIYGKPYDLITANLQDFSADLPKLRLVGRVEGGKFIPYYTRAEIEQNEMQAPVLMWGDDLVDINLMQIQGSAVAQMTDGSEVRIGFAESNGRPFKGIGRILLDKGLIAPGEASMPKIRDWLQQNPELAAALLAENTRYIFHRLTDADGPIGAMGVTLTAGRSLAVDNHYMPLGAMLWLDTTDPDGQPLQKIVFAQDIGSAIKGAVRGDYFWGHGEEALLEAGRMHQTGRDFILIPREITVEADDAAAN